MNNLVINNEKILLLLEQAIVNITEDEVNQNEVVLIIFLNWRHVSYISPMWMT